MGVRIGPLIVSEWMSTLGAMHRHGTRVIVSCSWSRCRKGAAVAMVPLVAQFGEDGSLWNREPACPSCGHPGIYMASGGPGTPFLPLIASPEIQGLPPSTIMTGRERQAFLRSFGFTPRDIARIRAMAERTCTNRMEAALSDLDVPFRVGAAPPEMARHSSGQVLGHWGGNVLLWWPMSEHEARVWASRPRGPRSV